MNTDAIEVEASKTIRIVGNRFERAQEKAFVNVQPTLETTTFEFADNTFHRFENGFLELPNNLGTSFGRFRLTNLVLQVVLLTS